LIAFFVQACGDDPPPLDGGTLSADGSAPVDEASTSDGHTTDATRSCPEACANVSSSSACVGKAYDEAKCLQFCPCITGAFRPELVQGALACIADCREGGSDDNCLADIYAPYGDDPETRDTVTACSARQAECRDAGGSLGTDVCALYGANPAFLAKMRGCLALSCADARACIRAAYDEAGCRD